MKTEKVYIKGSPTNGKDIINELVKHGAKSTSVLCGHSPSAYYYYIDKRGNIRTTDDIDLLDDAGYKMISAPSNIVLPYQSKDDLNEACSIHGKLVRNKCGYSLFDIDRIISLIKSHHLESEVYKHLSQYYEFEDGTPCGKLIE